MKDNKSIFNFFKSKRAREISDKMAKDKEDSRNLFLEKILENAKAYNKAKEDFESESIKEEE